MQSYAFLIDVSVIPCAGTIRSFSFFVCCFVRKNELSNQKASFLPNPPVKYKRTKYSIAVIKMCKVSPAPVAVIPISKKVKSKREMEVAPITESSGLTTRNRSRGRKPVTRSRRVILRAAFKISVI